MTSPELPAADPLKGSFLVGVLDTAEARITYLRGWERGRWWNSPMFFWDDFSADGEVAPESKDPGLVAAISLGRRATTSGGKRKKVYEAEEYATPYEKLKSLPQAEKYFKKVSASPDWTKRPNA